MGENLAQAIEHKMQTATILHPWNAELCELEDVTCARDWPELERMLAPLLASERRSLAYWRCRRRGSSPKLDAVGQGSGLWVAN